MGKHYELTEGLTNEIKLAVSENLSMRQAAKSFKMDAKTFKKLATEIGCWQPNPGGKGLSKPQEGYLLADILSGFYPKYHSYKLKKRLFKSGLKDKVCEICGLKDNWNNKELVLELHHKNGNSRYHLFENLQILCPNCHSQTETFRNKKRS